eukprot:scaffold737_cov254-Pinguiococcus_pyrenoidosus.AAC.3
MHPMPYLRFGKRPSERNVEKTFPCMLCPPWQGKCRPHIFRQCAMTSRSTMHLGSMLGSPPLAKSWSSFR